MRAAYPSEFALERPAEPGDEVADITEVIADRSRREILLLTEGLLILCQCKLARRGEFRVCLPLHAYLLDEKTLAEMPSEGYQEP